MGRDEQIQVKWAENTAVAFEKKAESTGVGECGDRDEWPENRKEQVCEVSGSVCWMMG